MRILVVGGGTAGLISALILKKRLNCKIDLVYSKEISTIGVGEGSTEHFSHFLNFVEINPFEIIKKCDATYKAGIMFKGWSDYPYLHAIGYPYDTLFGQYPIAVAHQVKNNYSPIASKYIWENKLNTRYLKQSEGNPINQFHFNTHKLNDFLKKEANKMGIKTIEDNILKVVLKKNQEIDYLIGNKQKYIYDFYIDCTGFKRLLISQLGAKWVSFKDHLKMKSAIVFQTEDTEKYNLWTTAKAMDYGWRFQLPVWGRHGNGYIFDSDYITADQAKEELDKEFGTDVEISKQFNFDPGYLNNVWTKNCVAMGLSGSFVEPLEATSIGTTIQQSFMLMHKITNYSDIEIKEYNKNFKEIMENIKEFIFIHYLTNKENSVFWKDMKKNNIPEKLSYNLKKWENKMPLIDDITKNSYELFNNVHYSFIMHGLRLFKKEEIAKEFDFLQQNLKNNIKFVIQEDLIKTKEEMNTIRSVEHKEFLRMVKKYG